MGILKGKIKSLRLPLLLLLLLLLLLHYFYKRILELHCIINAQYNHYISNTGPLTECDKEVSVAVTGAATASCLKIRL